MIMIRRQRKRRENNNNNNEEETITRIGSGKRKQRWNRNYDNNNALFFLFINRSHVISCLLLRIHTYIDR